MDDLAQTAMDAVTDGRVKFFPERYAKTYLDWLGEKRDWCISRQLWWGHRIPVWRIPEGKPSDDLAALHEALWDLQQQYPEQAAIQQFESLRESSGGEELVNVTVMIAVGPDSEKIEQYLDSLGLQQDPDVLDTWFSSALWPHSTLGWPGPALPGKPPGPQNP